MSPPYPCASRNFFYGTVTVLENVRLARDTLRIRLAAPVLASLIRPGQFLMIRLPGATDPLLGRPFALYDTAVDGQGQPTAVDVVYLIVGKLTALLARRQTGEQVEIWGPLGNGFPELTGRRHVALAAGGIGQTPFLAHVRDLLGLRGYGGLPACTKVERVSVFYGTRSADLLAGVEDFRRAGAMVQLATDDGSEGFHGRVTELLEQHLQAPRLTNADTPAIDHLVGCGPEPMLAALSRLAQRRDLRCHLSLETPMACGVGICFSCVTPVKTETGWDYRRVCIDGPVFDARELVWKH